jgi:LmbE family N-acetylglucosaminyl deacetylase
VHRLGQPDGGIDEDALAAALEPLLGPGRWCLATWRADGHPDHEAVGRAAARACTATGARLLEYPVWA